MSETPIPLSVFIITKDEADRVASTIASVVDWVDEVVVVDSGSSDDTVSLAQQAGARVLFHEFEGYGAQKRFAEDQCKNRWLLNIDADEPLTEEAQLEIKALLKSGKVRDFVCWRIPIKTIYPYEDGPAPWALTYNQIRLYDRQQARFAESPVHDSVIPQEGANIGQLTGSIAHRSYRSLTTQIGKINRYSDMQMEDMVTKGRRSSTTRLIIEFPLAFFKGYFIRRYWRYGAWGFAHAITYAYSRFLRLAKLHEKELLEKTPNRNKQEK